jgi:hypothetical protein
VYDRVGNEGKDHALNRMIEQYIDRLKDGQPNLYSTSKQTKDQKFQKMLEKYIKEVHKEQGNDAPWWGGGGRSGCRAGERAREICEGENQEKIRNVKFIHRRR